MVTAYAKKMSTTTFRNLEETAEILDVDVKDLIISNKEK